MQVRQWAALLASWWRQCRLSQHPASMAGHAANCTSSPFRSRVCTALQAAWRWCRGPEYWRQIVPGRGSCLASCVRHCASLRNCAAASARAARTTAEAAAGAGPAVGCTSACHRSSGCTAPASQRCCCLPAACGARALWAHAVSAPPTAAAFASRGSGATSTAPAIPRGGAQGSGYGLCTWRAPRVPARGGAAPAFFYYKFCDVGSGCREPALQRVDSKTEAWCAHLAVCNRATTQVAHVMQCSARCPAETVCCQGVTVPTDCVGLWSQASVQ